MATAFPRLVLLAEEPTEDAGWIGGVDDPGVWSKTVDGENVVGRRRPPMNIGGGRLDVLPELDAKEAGFDARAIGIDVVVDAVDGPGGRAAGGSRCWGCRLPGRGPGQGLRRRKG